MDRFNLIINHLEKIKSNTASKEDYKFIEDIIKIEAANYNTFSKLVYDIFLFFIKDVKDSNYTFEAYKSWYIKTKEFSFSVMVTFGLPTLFLMMFKVSTFGPGAGEACCSSSDFHVYANLAF